MTGRPIDPERVALALGATIRHATVSESREATPAVAAFRALHRELGDLFPRVHATLEPERIGEWSLLYTWRGTDPGLAPILLVAHQDVVPVEPGTEGQWRRPPFSGSVSDDAVWGRGALDDKGSLVAILAAVEDLLEQGFAPRRTLLLAFGHDEEIGGETGARAIAEELASRDVRPALVLDEGGAIADDVLPGLGPVALVGVAEKGQVSLELVVETEGGHSSMPPRQTSVGIVAAAVAALESRRPRARLTEATRGTLKAVAPRLPFLRRLVLGNVDLLEPLVLRVLARRQALDAAIRTTTAATVLSGGAKPNVLPERASAVVNYRILPGETVDSVVAHAWAAIDDERVRIQIEPGSTARDPSPTSPADGPAFDLLQRTIEACFPGVVVAPYLVLGGTDARHYASISDAIYRFVPLPLDAEGRARLHGTDERVGVDDLAAAAGFFRELIARAQDEI